MQKTKIDAAAAWKALREGESFFVPSLDTETAKKNLLSMGYEPRKNAPIVRSGIYRGMSGVLCYRQPSRERKRTENLDWF